jgi:hypothetical protein
LGKYLKGAGLVLLLVCLAGLTARASTVYVSGSGDFQMTSGTGVPIDEMFSVSYYLDTVTFGTTSLTATFTGPLGAFSLVSNNYVIDWLDSTGDYAQINPYNFPSTGFYPKVGTYSGLMDIECAICRPPGNTGSAIDYFGGTVTVSALPEPGVLSLSLIGLGLLFVIRKAVPCRSQQTI